MNALIKRSALLGTVFMFFLMLSQVVAAQTNVSASMTVDNEFDLYVSTLADNSDGVLVGSGADWTVADQLASALTPGVTNYINIVARNIGGPAMFLGEFSLDAVDFAFANGTQTLLTNTADWTVSEVGFGGATVATVGQGANGDPVATWGNFPLIDDAAVFIWGTNLAATPVYISAVVNPVVTDLELTMTESIDPVVAGSGDDNLTHVFTATNNGSDDATGTVTLVTSFNRPPGVTVTSLVVSQGSFLVDTWTIGPLANGASATATVVHTVDSSAAPGVDVISTNATLSGNEFDPDLSNNSASIATSVIHQATFDITKIWDGGEVDVTLTCDSGVVTPPTSTSGLSASMTVTGFADGAICSVTEAVPAGFAPSYSADCNVSGVVSGSVYSCDITNATATARFQVTKDFSDGSTDDVLVTLTCNTGLPLEQSLTIAGGDDFGVIFVVTDYIDGTMSCSVTEATNTPGYDPDTTGCVWNDVVTSEGPFSCVINNTAQDGTFTVNKVWNVFNEGGGDEVIEEANVTIWCDAEITNGYYDDYSEDWYIADYLGDGESLIAKVSTLTGSATCWANESINQSGVESSDDCGTHVIPAGGSDSCTFTNTVFFEGIPTLSQYGLALMALLMLGMGMVGFRRFA